MTVATAGNEVGPVPKLIATKQPDRPIGVALVLHGGAGRGTVPVSPTQLSVLRMIPIAVRVARAGHGRLAVFRLLNAVRGFGADPLSNVRWALDRLAELHPNRPISLVGHSLGGSVALAAAGTGQVRSVVALAPWLSGSESARRLGDTRILVVHGTDDRVTSAAGSQRFVRQARAEGVPASLVRVEHGEHTMLRRMPAFDVLAARYVHATLDPDHASARSGARYRPRLETLALTVRDAPGDYTI